MLKPNVSCLSDSLVVVLLLTFLVKKQDKIRHKLYVVEKVLIRAIHKENFHWIIICISKYAQYAYTKCHLPNCKPFWHSGWKTYQV